MEKKEKELEKLLSQQEEIDEFLKDPSEEQGLNAHELVEQHEKIFEQVSALNGSIALLTKLLKGQNSLLQLVSNLENQCSLFREQHHERELVLPLSLSFIGIADRCRKQIKELDEMLIKNKNTQNASAAKALQYIIHSRQADLAEIDNALANLGIESYQSPENIFSPEVHKCLQRIEHEKAQSHLTIAARILPGYRRYEKIVRKEIVNVYVNHTENSV